MLELKQGTVILELTIAADGTAKVTWPPVRPSGSTSHLRRRFFRRASSFGSASPRCGSRAHVVDPGAARREEPGS
ncbi:MAG: hypothetical protein KF782_24110 [Labilithrix sp.]|nr:hypothetical protein [Labilithrix sp.]